MKIAKDTVVTVNYHLHVLTPEGEKMHIESTEEEEPFRFLFGVGGMIAGFEKNLAGLDDGDKFDFQINPEDGYGQSREDAIVKLPIDIFKIEGVIDFEILKVGNTLPMGDDEGNEMNGVVLGYDDESATLDFNHPLAGQTLHFKGEILNVRQATADEIAHGHVH